MTRRGSPDPCMTCVKCFALLTAKIVPPRDISEVYGSLERPAERSIDMAHRWSTDPGIIARKSLQRFHPDKFAICGCSRHERHDFCPDTFCDDGQLLARSGEKHGLVVGLQPVCNEFDQ